LLRRRRCEEPHPDWHDRELDLVRRREHRRADHDPSESEGGQWRKFGSHAQHARQDQPKRAQHFAETDETHKHPGQLERQAEPIVDPLSADLTGWPPMLIQAATGDARIADAKALAIRAREHGVDVRLELFPLDAHAFRWFWLFLPEAADAIDIAGSYIHEMQSASVKSEPQRACPSSRAR
jgi:acetyl esterase/lipase